MGAPQKPETNVRVDCTETRAKYEANKKYDTNEFQFTIASVLVSKNIIYEGGHAPMPPLSTLLKICSPSSTAILVQY